MNLLATQLEYCPQSSTFACNLIMYILMEKMVYRLYILFILLKKTENDLFVNMNQKRQTEWNTVLQVTGNIHQSAITLGPLTGT